MCLCLKKGILAAPVMYAGGTTVYEIRRSEGLEYT